MGTAASPPLTSAQRWIVVLMFGCGWAVAHDGLFVLLVIVAAVRAFDTQAPTAGDRGALAQFAFLIAALAVVLRTRATITVVHPAAPRFTPKHMVLITGARRSAVSTMVRLPLCRRDGQA